MIITIKFLTNLISNFERTGQQFNILTFLNETYKGTENGEEIEIIFTNFCTAGDRVDIGILLRKLFSTGFRGRLLKSYQQAPDCSNKWQRVFKRKSYQWSATG